MTDLSKSASPSEPRPEHPYGCGCKDCYSQQFITKSSTMTSAEALKKFESEMGRKMPPAEANTYMYGFDDACALNQKAAEPRRDERARFATAMLGSLELCGIVFHEDLLDEGTPWECAAEPEPQYFETLTDAVRFYGELASRASAAPAEDTCPRCKGSGQIQTSFSSEEQSCVEEFDTCPICKGSGTSAAPLKQTDDDIFYKEGETPDVRDTLLEKQRLEFVRIRERISTADYELRQFVTAANITLGQRKRLEEIRKRMLAESSLPQPSAGQPKIIRSGFGEFELSTLADDEQVMASGLHDGGWVVVKRPSAGQTEGK